MLRRALWRAAPDDPRTPLGWFLADGGGPLAPHAALVFGIFVLGLGIAWSPWMLGVLPLLAIAARRPMRRADLSPLETVPAPGPAFPCRVEVVLDGGHTGSALLARDEGIATFVDGWLYLAGRRTEFALRHADLTRAATRNGGLWLGLPNGRTLTLTLLDERDAERLVRAYRLWSVVTPEPGGESWFPPLGVHPTGLARAWHDALFTGSAFMAFVAFLLAFRGGGWLFAFVGGGSLAAFRRLAEVRRLAREERLDLARGPA